MGIDREDIPINSRLVVFAVDHFVADLRNRAIKGILVDADRFDRQTGRSQFWR